MNPSIKLNKTVAPVEKASFDWAHTFLIGLVLLGVLVVFGLVASTIAWLIS